jgi:lipopolysaccharide export system permease protein
MIISRYIAWEVLRPFSTTVAMLALVFASYTTAVLLNDAAAGLVATATIVQFMLIKLVIALEVLVPFGLYLGVLLGLSRLYSDSETTALAACGVGEPAIFRTVIRLAVVVALLVLMLSLFLRPWAYQQRYILRAAAIAKFDISQVEPRRFYASPENDYLVYAETVDPQAREAERVFFQMRDDDLVRVIVADRLHQPPGEPTQPLQLVFSQGYAYQLHPDGGARDISQSFGRMTLRVQGAAVKEVGYKSKTQSTAALHGASEPQDLAEYQWRLSTPVATVLLAMLAIPMSRAPPRQGRFGRTVLGLLAYAVFYNLMAMAKNLVQEGLVGAVPGLWWPLVLLAVVVPVVTWPGLFRRPRASRSGRSGTAGG